VRQLCLDPPCPPLQRGYDVARPWNGNHLELVLERRDIMTLLTPRPLESPLLLERHRRPISSAVELSQPACPTDSINERQLFGAQGRKSSLSYLCLLGHIIDKIRFPVSSVLLPFRCRNRSLSGSQDQLRLVYSTNEILRTSNGDFKASGFSQVDSFVTEFAQ
jgi:hypothetical protein